MTKPREYRFIVLQDLKDFLDAKVKLYNRPEFITNDPISVPHRFNRKQDIEIAAFFAATLAWGQRQTIIMKANQLMSLMDEAPYDFIRHHKTADLKHLLHFRHRTFQPTDLLYFIAFLKKHYQSHRSLEACFKTKASEYDVTNTLMKFHDYFFSLGDVPERTRKHVSSPTKGSACKRLNMFLRWMVRNDDRGVDFGLWNSPKPSQLVCPVDVHVARVARALGVLSRKQTDWKAACHLTNVLRLVDPNDPVKYDYALFSLGVIQPELYL